MADLTIFYDGTCPLCKMEMDKLSARDEHQRIAFEDIYAIDFAERFPQINPARADEILHGQLASGQLLLGLDVTHKAWSLVGRGWLTQPLRWPVISPLADILYRLFAKHRYTVSYWLTGKKRCQNGQCLKP